MTIAEVHGKLTPENANERSEDLLTSDVFGTMHFVSNATPFFAWLGQSVSALQAGQSLGALLSMGVKPTVRIRFWPRFSTGREPDLAIYTISEDACWLIVIEVKYYSGLSNFDPESRENEFDGTLTGHQILDQLLAVERNGASRLLEQWFKEPRLAVPLRSAHILVTTDRTLPHSLYEEVSAYYRSHPAITNQGQRPIPFWLSWHWLLPTLLRIPGKVESVTDQRLLGHLISLLRYKQLGAIAFQAFDGLPSPRFGGSGSFWSERLWFTGITEAFELIARSGPLWWNKR